MWNFRTGPISLIDSKLKKKKERNSAHGTKLKKYPSDIQRKVNFPLSLLPVPLPKKWP